MNKKSLIFNSIITGLMVLLVILTAIPSLGEFNIYQLIGRIGEGEVSIFMGIGLIVFLISMYVLLIGGIYGILRALNVIKYNRIDRLVKILMFSFAIALVAGFSPFFSFVEMIAEGAPSLSGECWSVFVTMPVSIATLVLACLERKN